MDPQLAKYLMLGAVFVGAFVLVPIVMALLSHQQKMAELIHKTTSNASEVEARLSLLEQRLAALSPEAAATPSHSTEERASLDAHNA